MTLDVIMIWVRVRHFTFGLLGRGVHLTSSRILVVDPFPALRALICDIIAECKSSPVVHVVAEASNGLEGVQKAVAMRPDVVLLEMALPDISGIEAAREIRKQAPECKVLFVSQHHSPMLVLEALNTGAHGYLLKSELVFELIPALQALALNRQFISNRLACQFNPQSGK
jgi:two-component system response regulator NreC